MYADDLVEWLLTLADNANINCPIFNVGSDREIEIRDLAYLVSKVFNVGLNIYNDISSEFVDRYIPSIDKAQKELGLSSNYEIIESICKSSDIEN